MKIIAVIPARGGSKRLPRKNLVEVGGLPLVAHSIRHALASRYVRQTIVSTDDPEIARVAAQYEARVILRPAALSSDAATSESALLHVLDELKRSDGFTPDLLVFLQCTSPVRETGDIDRAIETLLHDKADSLFSVTRNERYLWEQTDKGWRSINYDYRRRWRDQNFPRQVRENGSIYICKPELLRRESNRLGGKITVFEMDYWSSFQIDTLEHAALCSWILERKNGQNHRQGL